MCWLCIFVFHFHEYISWIHSSGDSPRILKGISCDQALKLSLITHTMLSNTNEESGVSTIDKKRTIAASSSSDEITTCEECSRSSEDPKTKKAQKRSDVIRWDDYFMAVSYLSAMRSKDPSTQVGACIVNPDKRIVGIGYNGFPRGCSDDELPWCRHAENELDTKYPVSEIVFDNLVWYRKRWTKLNLSVIAYSTQYWTKTALMLRDARYDSNMSLWSLLHILYNFTLQCSTLFVNYTDLRCAVPLQWVRKIDNTERYCRSGVSVG